MQKFLIVLKDEENPWVEVWGDYVTNYGGFHVIRNDNKVVFKASTADVLFILDITAEDE